MADLEPIPYSDAKIRRYRAVGLLWIGRTPSAARWPVGTLVTGG